MEVNSLQDDISRIVEWTVEQKLPLNIDKCKVMHIGKRNLKAKYSLIGKVIEETDAEKDLGEKTYK